MPVAPSYIQAFMKENLPSMPNLLKKLLRTWKKNGTGDTAFNLSTIGSPNSTIPESDVTRHGINNLPAELLPNILSMLVSTRRAPPGGSPFVALERAILSDLCRAARVCRLWSQCAQAVIFEDVCIESECGRTSLYQATDPATERGRWLGGLVVSLTIAYWGGKPLTKHWIFKPTAMHEPLFKPQQDIVEQTVQRCTNLKFLAIKYALWPYRDPMESSISKMELPATLRHLEISITDWPDHALPLDSPAVHQLIARTSSLTSLHLETLSGSSMPPQTTLPPTFRLVTFRAFQFDHLSEWVLQHSRDTLQTLALKEPTDLRKLGKTFPNVKTLSIGGVTPGDSLEEFKKLEFLYGGPVIPAEAVALLYQFPQSIRQVTTRVWSVIPEIQGIIDSGIYPNFESVRYQSMSYSIVFEGMNSTLSSNTR